MIVMISIRNQRIIKTQPTHTHTLHPRQPQDTHRAPSERHILAEPGNVVVAAVPQPGVKLYVLVTLQELLAQLLATRATHLVCGVRQNGVTHLSTETLYDVCPVGGGRGDGGGDGGG